MLKEGDLVKYHIKDANLDQLGFKFGNLYAVLPINGLSVVCMDNIVTLIDQNELTDYCDNFTLFKCPIDLPKGIV